MGICESKISIYEINLKLAGWRDQFEALQITGKEIEQIYRIFRKVDVDNSGTIELAELLVHIEIERTKFSERIFSIFDEDSSGQIDFREFVLSLWNYCTLSKTTLEIFAFDLYDIDSSGWLSPSEVSGMLRDVYGRHAKDNQYAKFILKELSEIEADGDLDIDAFRFFCKTHSAMLFPAFNLQTALQKRIMGRGFWDRHANRRIEVCRGQYMPIAKFMEIHLDKNLLNNFLFSAEVGNSMITKKAMLLVENTGTHAYRKGNATGEVVEKVMGLE